LKLEFSEYGSTKVLSIANTAGFVLASCIVWELVAVAIPSKITPLAKLQQKLQKTAQHKKIILPYLLTESLNSFSKNLYTINLATRKNFGVII
jgi:spore coat polysaccharide biosynthesis predicted glycosyltransferase SpsG